MLSLLALLLAQLGLLLVIACLLGSVAQWLLLPAVVGELLAGVILGPTLLGRVPSVSGLLFPSPDPVAPIRANFLTVGLLLFILLVGTEIDVDAVRHRLRTIVPTSAVGMLVPFSIGFAAALLFPALWGPSQGGQPLGLAFIVGVALSISALPVIARTLTDLGLVRTEIGRIILSSAVIDDISGWVAFAAVVSVFTTASESNRPLWITVLLVLVAFALSLTIGRKIGGQFGAAVARTPRLAGLGLALVAAAALLASAVMDSIGVHAFFGALLVGVALSSVNERFFDPLSQIVRYFFTPLYFGAVALSVDFFASFDLLLVVTVCLIASVGKLLGAGLGARLGGCSIRNASAIAAGMNARGAVEILLATIARQAGLIDDRLFVALVIMALVTSVTAGTLIQRILKVDPPGKLVKAVVPVLQRLDPFGRPVDELQVGERLTIGRHPSNRLALVSDPRVSLEHALIKRANGHFRIEDLDSTNGTLLWHDTRWRNVMLDDLHDGDIVVVGSNVFRFSRGAQSNKVEA
jgi:Kef-type K+ transport system membrane component KefB